MGLFSRGESRADRREREYQAVQSQRLADRFNEIHREMDERDARRKAANGK